MRPEHDQHLHLGCGPCRRSLSFSYHKDHPPSAQDRACPDCGEPMEELKHDEGGRLTHEAWEPDE